MPERRYTRTEVEEILRRAAARSEGEGSHLDHEDLVQAAREAGIDVGALELEAGEIETRRQEQQWIDNYRADRRAGWRSHAMTYAVIILGLALLNVATLGAAQVWWFIYPLIVWGMFLAMHGVRAFGELSPRKTERILRRQRRKMEREARVQAVHQARRAFQAKVDRVKTRGLEFDRVVDAGVDALLAAVTRKISEATKAKTEFERHVEQQRRASEGAPRGGVRVEVLRDEDDDEERSGSANNRRARRP